LSRATVELGGDRIQGGLVELAQVGASEEVLAEQTVGVLVLPRCQGLRGSKKYTWTPVSTVNLMYSAISRSSRSPARPATVAPGGGGP
jgi:hypothetical protein